jgi:hypothetical protein
MNKEVMVKGYEENGKAKIVEVLPHFRYPFVVEFLDDSLDASEKFGYFEQEDLIFLD